LLDVQLSVAKNAANVKVMCGRERAVGMAWVLIAAGRIASSIPRARREALGGRLHRDTGVHLRADRAQYRRTTASRSDLGG
jgi:hypothetical protein